MFLFVTETQESGRCFQMLLGPLGPLPHPLWKDAAWDVVFQPLQHVHKPFVDA